MDTDTDVVPILAHGVRQMLVDGDATCLQRLTGDLLLLIAHQMRNEGEEIDGGLLGTDYLAFAKLARSRSDKFLLSFVLTAQLIVTELEVILAESRFERTPEF